MPDPQSAPINPFVYTDTPAGYATPEQVAQLRSLSQYNMTGMPEAKSWAGVLGHALGGFTGNSQMNQANQMQQQGLASAGQVQSNIGQGGGGLLGGSPPMAGGAGTVGALAPRIAQMESGGNYGAVGPKTKTGDRAYGKYQVMGNNIPGWTQQILGQSMTPQQFLANPQAQEAVYKGKMGQYVQQTGNPQDAASMWFSGKPLAQALRSGNRPDVNGTTPSAYSAAVVGALRGQPPQMAQASPTTGMTGPQYGAIMANPWISQETKNQYQHAQTPQTYTTATGEVRAIAPGQAPPGQLSTGWVSGNVATPNATVPVGQPTSQGQPTGTGPFTQGQGLNTTVKGAAGLGNDAGEIANDLLAVNTAKEGLPAANARLGQIQSFRALGQDVDSGAMPQWETLAARFGAQWGSTEEQQKLGRQQAYQAMAEQILGGKDDSFKASIPGLSTTPNGRQIIADYLENQAKYQQHLGQIAAFGKGTATQRRQQMLQLPAPQSYFSQSGAPQQPQGAAPPPNAPVNPKQAPQQSTSKPAQAASGAGAPAAQGIDVAGSRANAAAAIKARPGARAGIIAKLQAHGIDTSGL